MKDYTKVLSVFNFNDASGLLTWAINPSRKIHIGDIAGTLNDSGYLVVKYQGEDYRAHRIIYLKCIGVIPDGMEIDHIDGNRSNNHLNNLRLVTRQQNQFNKRASKANKFGLKGVSSNGPNGYRALATMNGRQINLGTYVSPELAHRAYVKFSLENHLHHSVFAS